MSCSTNECGESSARQGELAVTFNSMSSAQLPPGKSIKVMIMASPQSI